MIHSNYMWFFFPWCASYFFKIVYFLPQIILKCMHAPEMIKIQLHIRLCSCGHVYARNKSRVLQRAHDVVILHTASSSMPLYERTKGMPPPFYEVYMRRQTESKTDEHVDSWLFVKHNQHGHGAYTSPPSSHGHGNHMSTASSHSAEISFLLSGQNLMFCLFPFFLCVCAQLGKLHWLKATTTEQKPSKFWPLCSNWLSFFVCVCTASEAALIESNNDCAKAVQILTAIKGTFLTSFELNFFKRLCGIGSL